MRDLSLHILDLVENSLRASARRVAIGIAADRGRDLLELVIEDDGEGLAIAADLATDPFYTTKEGKKTGLGLSLLKAAAQQAGGNLKLAKSAMGGLAVRASMQLSHLDRCPIGDLSATICSIVCTNPDLDLRLSFRCDGNAFEMNVIDLAAGCGGDGLAIASRVGEFLAGRLPREEETAFGRRDAEN